MGGESSRPSGGYDNDHRPRGGSSEGSWGVGTVKAPGPVLAGPKYTSPSGSSVTIGVNPGIGGGGAGVGIGVKKTF